jgi:uncharacterized protein with ParB-like and HNH nuclease domain
MKATETTILKFIGGEDKVFIIPPFQRNYEWTTEQCEELFEDILIAVKSNKNHYLGNIIYYEGENNGASFSENILIDGQQRVTSILLLLCAIRDITSDDSLKKKINRKYLQNEDAGDSYRVRLKQTDYDEGCFERLVDGTFGTDEMGKIADNYRRFKELIEGCDIDPKVLFEIIPKLEVVEVNLQTSALETVQTIFEKINSTGKPLSAADLLRNYLLITNNAKEQERLYKDYWVKIEEIITTEHISEFVKDYLIMKICEDVEKAQVYKDFKNYVLSFSLSHEDVLKDMRAYAPFYKMILTNDSGNTKLDREIKILKYLASTDMYCLFMYLLKRCKDEKSDPLKIFNLIRCFLTRFRIVGASGGGGALRSVVQTLVDKMQSKQIDCSFEAIQFELSNSSNKSGRYPDDDDFKTSLMISKKNNYNYGIAILLAIEEYETKNIPVGFDDVTIEHLMPQTPSDWWIKSLGGKDKAELTYNNYLNCIGNLAPLSGGYNSKNSNKPWTEKVKIMKDVQFKTTKEVLEKSEWNEESIINRNEILADRACKAILAPIPRTRAYASQKTFDDFVPGIYPISDLDTDMNGTDIKSVTIHGEEFLLDSWNQLLVKISEYVLAKDYAKFDNIVKRNLLHKDRKSKNPPEFDPILSENKVFVNAGKKIGSSKYYVEGNISCSRARFFANLLLQQYGFVDSCTIEVDKKSD